MSVYFTITYKNGHVAGYVGSDTLTITDSPIVLTNQTLGLTDSATLDFSNASCDGIFVSVSCPTSHESLPVPLP